MGSRILSIASNTFRETIRNKILYAILAFALFVIGLTYFLADLSVGDLARIIADLGLACIHVFGVIMAVFIGITLVSQEVEKKTIYLILSRPVPRWEFIFGKALGLSGTLALITLVMALVLFGVHAAYGRSPEIGILIASAGIYMELVLIVCLASLFSTFTTPVLSAIFTLSMFLIGHVSRDLLSFGALSASDSVRVASKILFYVLPNLENFNWKNEVVYGQVKSLAVAGLAAGYLVLYGAGVLVLACLLFFPEGFQVTPGGWIPGPSFLIPAAFLLGTCIGSFLNVLIHRLPREESIVLPGSRCPSCGRPIRPWENIPLAGFLLLGGKCRGCGVSISLRYPGVEALTGAGFAILAWTDGAGFTLLRDLVFFSLLVPITFIDLDHRIIPDELSLGGLAAGLLLSFLPGGDWKGSVLGGLLGGGLFYGTARGYEMLTGREGMGGGDIKLIAMIGAFLGWKGAVLTILGGALLGLAGGLLAMRKSDKGLKTAIPFGPYLCFAALAARFGGDAFWSRFITGI